MNKKEMAAALAQQANLSQAKAADVLNCIFDTNAGSGIIAGELDSGGKVTVPGFGTFGVKLRAARTGTNPATGQKIEIAAKNYAYFKPGKPLRDRIAG